MSRKRRKGFFTGVPYSPRSGQAETGEDPWNERRAPVVPPASANRIYAAPAEHPCSDIDGPPADSRGSPRARPGQASGRFGTPQGKLDLVADARRGPRAIRALLACYVLHPISLRGQDEANHRAHRLGGLLRRVANPSNSAIARAIDFGRKRRNSETAFCLYMRNRTAGGISRSIVHAVRVFVQEPSAEQPRDSFADVFAMRVVELVRTAMRVHQLKKFGIGSRPRKKPLRAISCNDWRVRTVAPYRKSRLV